MEEKESYRRGARGRERERGENWKSIVTVTREDKIDAGPRTRRESNRIECEQEADVRVQEDSRRRGSEQDFLFIGRAAC